MFGLVVKPAFTSISKNFSQVVSGHRLSLPNTPEQRRDKQGLLESMKLEFLVETAFGQQQLRKVVLHIYSTQTKIMTQGGSAFSDNPDSPTVAQWFVANFVLPQIEDQVKKSGTTRNDVSGMNQAILRLRPAPSSQLSSLPPKCSQDGANPCPVNAVCGLCRVCLDGRTKNRKTCSQCQYFFHGKCFPGHPCNVAVSFQPPSTSSQSPLHPTVSRQAAITVGHQSPIKAITYFPQVVPSTPVIDQNSNLMPRSLDESDVEDLADLSAASPPKSPSTPQSLPPASASQPQAPSTSVTSSIRAPLQHIPLHLPFNTSQPQPLPPCPRFQYLGLPQPKTQGQARLESQALLYLPQVLILNSPSELSLCARKNSQ